MKSNYEIAKEIYEQNLERQIEFWRGLKEEGLDANRLESQTEFWCMERFLDIIRNHLYRLYSQGSYSGSVDAKVVRVYSDIISKISIVFAYDNKFFTLNDFKEDEEWKLFRRKIYGFKQELERLKEDSEGRSLAID